jgi:hypothetical protein
VATRRRRERLGAQKDSSGEERVDPTVMAVSPITTLPVMFLSCGDDPAA